MTLFIVPGLYEGVAPFQPLITELERLGHKKTVVSSLRSTGTSSIPPPGIQAADDIRLIAEDLTKAVEEAGDGGVVGLFHSAGGWIGSGALEGLTMKERKAAGKTGGVRKIIFVASALLTPPPPGKPRLLPFMEVNAEDGTQSCKDPASFLFHDLPAGEAEKWASKMQHQPLDYIGSYKAYEGWIGVPNVWFITEKDRLLPVPMQEASATRAEGKTVKIDSGHVPMLSMTNELARLVVEHMREGS